MIQKYVILITLQCISCLSVYIGCALTSSALFYGQEKTTIAGGIALSFYCGFIIFLCSKPRERNISIYTQTIFDSRINTKQSSLTEYGETLLAVCQNMNKLKKDENDGNDKKTSMIKDINISETENH